jgi:hypothetical protein
LSASKCSASRRLGLCRRRESDLNFGNIVKDGGFGKFNHRREPAAIDNQTVIWLNRDTLYSSGCSISTQVP